MCPAECSASLFSGAVQMACTFPAIASSLATRMYSYAACPATGESCPHGRSSGSSARSITFTRPGVNTASSTFSMLWMSASMPRTSAAWRRRSASPITTGRHSALLCGSSTAATTTSGPTPAPSPMVTAT
jgi:hypothetical protein